MIFRTFNHFAAIRSVQLTTLLLITLAILATQSWQGFNFFSELQHEQLSVGINAPQGIAKTDKPALSKALIQLLGSTEESADQGHKTAEIHPESNLNLQVSAIFFMVPPGKSSVIVEDGDRTLILTPGEEVRPGITIQAIESNLITLKRNGKLEQISFREHDEANSDTPGLSTLPAQEQSAENAAIAPEMATATATATEQNTPTAYQQYIQRKLALNK